MTAVYRLVIDHYVGTRFLEAGSTVTAGVEVPADWVPDIGGVDPISSDAIQAVWNAGPGTADLGQWPSSKGGRWEETLVPRASIYWVPTGNGQFILTGAGASLGARGQQL
jgi:hypothetical protein